VTRREFAVAGMAENFHHEIIKRAGWTKTTGGKGSHEKWIDGAGKRVVIRPEIKKPTQVLK
jgi:hypothetical protein